MGNSSNEIIFSVAEAFIGRLAKKEAELGKNVVAQFDTTVEEHDEAHCVGR